MHIKSGPALLLGTCIVLAGALCPSQGHESTAPPLSPERQAAAAKYQSTHHSSVQKLSQPPADFPIPMIGGSKFLSAANLNSQARKQSKVLIQVNQAPAAVASWYRDNLPQKGWKVVSIVKSDRTVLAMKDDLVCNLSINPATAQSCNVYITVMKDNKPKEGSSQVR